MIASKKSEMEAHEAHLSHVCRVGGKKFAALSQNIRYNVQEYKDKLLTAFNIDVSADDNQVHPQYICILCQRTLLCAREKAVHCGGGCGPVYQWLPHKRANCSFCSEQQAPKGRGRPPKRKSSSATRAQTVGRSKRQYHEPTVTIDTATSEKQPSYCCGIDVPKDDLYEKAMPTYKAECDLAVQRFIDQNAVVTCPLCKHAVDRAIATGCCQETYCCDCIYNWLETSEVCPACDGPLMASMLISVHQQLQRVIGNFTVHCDYHAPALRGCSKTVRVSELQDHVSQCEFNPSNASSRKLATVGMSSTVSEVLAASPSKLQGNVSER